MRPFLACVFLSAFGDAVRVVKKRDKSAGGKAQQYYELGLGQCCCPRGQQLSNLGECRQAAASLIGVSLSRIGRGHDVTSPAVPAGCSYAGKNSNQVMWNNNPTGQAMSGLSPICKAPACITWSAKLDGIYVKEQHGKTNECYDTLEQAQAVCASSHDCGAVATQSSVCNGRFRVSHGGPTLKSYAEWERYNLWAWTADRSQCSTEVNCYAFLSWSNGVLPLTEYDRHWRREAPLNNVISGITSWHDNYFEDRQFIFGYKVLSPGRVLSSRWSDWLNGWDDRVMAVCGEFQVLTGIESAHSDFYEDRRWKIRCSKVDATGEGRRWWTDELNNMDGSFTLSDMGSAQLLVGFSSWHDNYYEDRKFKFKFSSFTKCW